MSTAQATDQKPTQTNVHGYARAESGVGEVSRLIVATVRAANLSYSLNAYDRTPSRQRHRPLPGDCPRSPEGIHLVAVNADQFGIFMEDQDPPLTGYKIGIWAWEVEEFPEWMAQSEAHCDEIWGISSFTANAIRERVRKPVYAFPLPIAAPTPAQGSLSELGVADSRFRFHFCFDFDSVFDRKNPLAVVSAFRTAFPEPDTAGPTLVIKSVNGARPHHQPNLQRLHEAAEGRSDIQIFDGYWDSDDQKALIASSDAYVSLHRAEGFGLTLGEAMALAKPVIATGYSGNLDFMTESTSVLVPFERVRVGPGCEPYDADGYWAEPDVEFAAEKMRWLVEHPSLARAIGLEAKVHVDQHHTPAHRAEWLVERLHTATRLANASLPTAQLPTPWAGVNPRSRLAAEHLLQEGPPMSGTSRFGPLGMLGRRLVFRMLRNYHLHQRDLQANLLAQMQELEARVNALTTERNLHPRPSNQPTEDTSDSGQPPTETS